MRREPAARNPAMKILYLTQWYWPEPITYQCDLAETLQELGHEVVVVTGFPNYPTGKLTPGYRIRPWQWEVIRGVRTLRVPLVPDHSRIAWRRALNFLSFAMCAASVGLVLAPRCDIVHCNFPPVTLGVPAWLLSRRMRAALTFETQDLWPETLAATGMMRGNRMLRMIDRAVQWGYRRADAIRVITPGFRENLISKGIPPDKIHVISNWVDPDRYRPVEAVGQLAERLGLAGRFNVMFAGTIGLAQGLDVMLDTAASLHDLADLQFVVVGDGADLSRLQRLVTERQLTNVRFLGRFAPEEMSKLYALANVLWLNLRDDPLFRITIPHKVFAYLASGKPVLNTIEGDAAGVIAAAEAGVNCKAGDAAALAGAVRRLYQLSTEDRRRLGENGLTFVRSNYGRCRLVKETEQMLAEVVRRRRR